MGKVVMYSSVSVDGFVADENDQPGPLFDWLSSGDVPLDESGEVKVSRPPAGYPPRERRGFARRYLAGVVRDVALHRRVEGDARHGEVRPTNERESVLGAVLAIHPRVLPFDGERAGVADQVECSE